MLRGPEDLFAWLNDQNDEFEVANDAYADLIEKGPLKHLFVDDRTRFGSAKGGSDPRFADFHDQTHFQHSLNVATAAGVLFCSSLHEASETPSHDEIRVVLAAGALHDFDKIVCEQYPECLSTHDGLFRQYLEGFIADELHDSIKHLILATEDGTDGDADAYPCILKGRIKLIAIAALAAADTLSTTGRDLPPDDARHYQAILNKLRLKHGGLLPQVHVLPLHDVPQTALMAIVRQALLDWIRRNGLLLHDSPRRFSWIGKPWGESANQSTASKALDLLKPDFKDVVATWTIRGNSPKIRTDWIDDYEPTRERVIEIIAEHGSKLILWDREWVSKVQLSRLNSHCKAIVHAQRSGQDTANLELPEETGTVENQRLGLQAQIILASCILRTLTGDESTTNPNADSWAIGDAKSTARKYVAGIVDVIEREPTTGLLNEILDECVLALKSLQAGGEGNPDMVSVVSRCLGQDTSIQKAGSTGQACVICGSFSSMGIDKKDFQGAGSDGWFPRAAAVQKQTSGKGNDARICPVCLLDSNRRAIVSNESGIKASKAAQYIHIHKSDTAVESHYLQSMKAMNEERVVEGQGIALEPTGTKNKSVIPVENHVSTPIRSTGSGADQMRLLSNVLSLIHDTGYKVQVTSLGGIPRLHPCMLHWQNAPSWVKDLRPRDHNGVWSEGLSEIRCDRIPVAQKIVQAIDAIAETIRRDREAKKKRHDLLLNTLTSNPLGLYRFPCHGSKPCFHVKNLGQHPTTTLETYFMTNETIQLLETAGHAYCKFNTREKSAWGTSNHWQWATRSVLRQLERHSDLAPQAARGLLLAEAQRKNSRARSEDIDDFVETMTELRRMHGADNDQVARDIIAAIQWTAERLYHEQYSKKARDGGNT